MYCNNNPLTFTDPTGLNPLETAFNYVVSMIPGYNLYSLGKNSTSAAQNFSGYINLQVLSIYSEWKGNSGMAKVYDVQSYFYKQAAIIDGVSAGGDAASIVGGFVMGANMITPAVKIPEVPITSSPTKAAPKAVAATTDDVIVAAGKGGGETPYDFLQQALKRQGLDKPGAGLKEKWVQDGIEYEVRVHPADPAFGKNGNIFRVGRRQPGVDANGQGKGWEYMDSSGEWWATRELKNNNAAAEATHIEVPKEPK